MGKQRKKSRYRQNRNRQRFDSVSWAGLGRQLQAGVRREGRQTVFATSFWGTLFMPLVTGLLLVFIVLLVFLAVLLADAKAHDQAGAAIVLMECVPAELAKKVTETVSCPTIGIGAGVDCDGQVLVMHDMLGIFPGKTAKFVKNFMQGKDGIQAAVEAYVHEVKAKTFPAAEHSFA